jgi:hypothetical protein
MSLFATGLGSQELFQNLIRQLKVDFLSALSEDEQMKSEMEGGGWMKWAVLTAHKGLGTTANRSTVDEPTRTPQTCTAI